MKPQAYRLFEIVAWPAVAWCPVEAAMNEQKRRPMRRRGPFPAQHFQSQTCASN